jgi:hypothetical protein
MLERVIDWVPPAPRFDTALNMPTVAKQTKETRMTWQRGEVYRQEEETFMVGHYPSDISAVWICEVGIGAVRV